MQNFSAVNEVFSGGRLNELKQLLKQTSTYERSSQMSLFINQKKTQNSDMPDMPDIPIFDAIFAGAIK